MGFAERLCWRLMLAESAALRRLGVQAVAAGVWQLHAPVPNAINAFFLASESRQGGVLVDARTVLGVRRLQRQLEALREGEGFGSGDSQLLSLHALTHAHPDHTGATAFICKTFGVPLWVGHGDADTMEGRVPMRVGPTWSPLHSLPYHLWSGPTHPVAHRMSEGDALLDSGFAAVACPGHTAGHTAFWRESDRLLICGDALANFRLGPGGLPGFSLPPRLFNADEMEMRRSVVRLAALRPSTLLFGHGQRFDNQQGDFERYAESLQAV